MRLTFALAILAVPAAAQVWTSIGPSPVSGNNGSTGRITVLSVDPSDPKHWMLGSAGGGVWNGTDGGASWAPRTDAQASLSIGSIAFAPSNSKTIYAGTGEATYAAHAQAGQGILKSTDGGATWSLVGAGSFARTAVGVIRVHPTNPNQLVAVNSRANFGRDTELYLRSVQPPTFGVKISTDGGVSWTQTLAGEATSLEVDPTNFNNQFTAISLPAGYGAYYSPAATGVYRSGDGGLTWVQLAGPWSGTLGRIVLALSPSNPGTLYASIQGSNGHLLGLYRTDNARAASVTWTQVAVSGSWSTQGSNYVDYCGSNCTTPNVLAVDPSDPNTLYAGGASLWRCSQCSVNATWTDIGYNPQGQWSVPAGKRCVTWSASLLISCTDGGLFTTSSGGGPWQDSNAGLSVVRFVSGVLHPTDPNGIFAGTQDNGAALWSGGGWRSVAGFQGEVALSAAQPGQNLMASNGSRIFRSTNGGQSFVAADGGFDASNYNFGYLPVRKCPSNDDLFISGTGTIQRTNNFFSGATAAWTANGPAGDPITTIAFAPSDAKCNTYAYGTSTGRLWITVNGGGSWSNLDPGQAIPGRTVNSLAFDSANANILYAALGGLNGSATTPGHLFQTTTALSGSPQWADVSPGVDEAFNVVTVDPSHAGSVYVGTDVGVWRSVNAGNGWQFLGPATGLPNVPVYDLKINPATSRIVAFTFGRGAWSLNPQVTPASGALPAFSSLTAIAATLGTSTSLAALATGGTAPYTYTLIAGALPLGLVLGSSGQITGTPLTAGVFTFTVLLTDGVGNQASQTFTLTVGTSGKSPVWTNIGPSPLAYQVNQAGINSGRVATIAVDPGDATHWLVGYGNGGIWETHNSGGAWQPIAGSAPTPVIGAIAFAPSNPKVIYAGTGEADGTGFTKAGAGMLKSTDGGATWPVVNSGNFTRASVKRVRVNPANADNVLAITSRGGMGRESVLAPSPPPMGVLRSTDGGVTWTRTLAGQATGLEVSSANFNNQYAAIGDESLGLNDNPGALPNGLYRSTDGGQTWAGVPGPWGTATASSAPFGWIELAISTSSPNTLYASFAQAGGGNAALFGLYRTDNAWDPVPNWILIPTASTGSTGYCGPTKCNYSNVITVHPTSPDTLFAFGGENGLNGAPDSGSATFRCTTCGANPTWTYLGNSAAIPHTDHHAAAWAGTVLIDGSDGGVWSTADSGSTWQNLNATISTNMFFSGDLHPSNPDFILGGLRDFQVSTRSNGNTWLVLPKVGAVEWGEAEVAVSSSAPDTNWMAAWIWGVISRTTDGGQTRIEADSGIDVTASAFVAPVRKCPNNDNVFLTGTNRVWRTNNFFSSSAPAWAANGPAGSPNTRGSQATVLAIAYAPSDTNCNTYAYGTQGGQIQLTKDGGNTWTDLDPNHNLPARGINGLAFDPTNPNILYLGLSSFNAAGSGKPGHVFKSTSALSASPSFADISPLEDQPFNVVAVDPASPSIVYAGSDLSLWRSNNGGTTWVQQGADLGMPLAPIYDIKMNPATGRTVAFTYGRGAFTLGPETLSVMASPDRGATFVAAPLVPGAWARVQGRNLAGVSAVADAANPPLLFNRVQVTANGIAAAIYSVSPGQVTFQVPAGVSGNVTIQLLREGVPSNVVTAPSSVAPTPPSPTGTQPPAGAALSQTFTFTFSDASGYQNLQVADVLINSALDGRQACYLAFAPSSGSLFLVDDQGDAGGPYQGIVLPGNGNVGNSQCSVSGAGSGVSGSGTTLTLTLAITFSASFGGNKVVYTSAQDQSGANSGWQALGTWTVPTNVPAGPSVTGMNPARTTSAGPTAYTFTFSDTSGWQDIGVANILIQSAIDGRHACYVAFVPASGSLFLVDDQGDGGGPYQGMVLPGTGTVNNSQCTIAGAGSSFSGNGNTLTLVLSISFSGSFAGNQLFFLAARNGTQNSGWQAVGSVSVP